MSTAPARFTFDLDLRDVPQHGTLIDDATRNAMLAQARADGYAEGFAAGERSAMSASAAALATAASILADRSRDLLGGLDLARHAAEAEAVNLAASIAKKLASALIADQPASDYRGYSPIASRRSRACRTW